MSNAPLPTDHELASMGAVDLLAVAASLTNTWWAPGGPRPDPDVLAIALHALDLAAERGEEPMATEVRIILLLADRQVEAASALIGPEISGDLARNLYLRLRHELPKRPGAAVVLAQSLARHGHWYPLTPLAELIERGEHQRLAQDPRWSEVMAHSGVIGRHGPADLGDDAMWDDLMEALSSLSLQHRGAVQDDGDFLQLVQDAVLEGRRTGQGQLVDALQKRFARLDHELDLARQHGDEGSLRVEVLQKVLVTMREAHNLVDLDDPLDGARLDDYLSDLAFRCMVDDEASIFDDLVLSAPDDRRSADELPSWVERWHDLNDAEGELRPLLNDHTQDAASLYARIVGARAAVSDAHGIDTAGELEDAEGWSTETTSSGNPYSDRRHVRRLLWEARLRMELHGGLETTSADLIATAEAIALQALRADDLLPAHAFLLELGTPRATSAPDRPRIETNEVAAAALDRVVHAVREMASPEARDLRAMEADYQDDPSALAAPAHLEDGLRELSGLAARATAQRLVPDQRRVDVAALRAAVDLLILLPPNEDRAAFEIASRALHPLAGQPALPNDLKELRRWLQRTVVTSGTKAMRAASLSPYDATSRADAATTVDAIQEAASALLTTAEGDELAGLLEDVRYLIAEVAACNERGDLRQTLAHEAMRLHQHSEPGARLERPQAVAPPLRLARTLQQRANVGALASLPPDDLAHGTRLRRALLRPRARCRSRRPAVLRRSDGPSDRSSTERRGRTHVVGAPPDDLRAAVPRRRHHRLRIGRCTHDPPRSRARREGRGCPRRHRPSHRCGPVTGPLAGRGRGPAAHRDHARSGAPRARQRPVSQRGAESCVGCLPHRTAVATGGGDPGRPHPEGARPARGAPDGAARDRRADRASDGRGAAAGPCEARHVGDQANQPSPTGAALHGVLTLEVLPPISDGARTGDRGTAGRPSVGATSAALRPTGNVKPFRAHRPARSAGVPVRAGHAGAARCQRRMTQPVP